jgi:hypothetical protein
MFYISKTIFISFYLFLLCILAFSCISYHSSSYQIFNTCEAVSKCPNPYQPNSSCSNQSEIIALKPSQHSSSCTHTFQPRLNATRAGRTNLKPCSLDSAKPNSICQSQLYLDKLNIARMNTTYIRTAEINTVNPTYPVKYAVLTTLN